MSTLSHDNKQNLKIQRKKFMNNYYLKYHVIDNNQRNYVFCKKKQIKIINLNKNQKC